MKINFYNVDLKYIEFLKKYETEHRGFTRVPNVNYHSNNNKFFYGAVLDVNGINYFVPVSSKTNPKQDDMVINIKDKKKTNYGTLRFAYMIPIPNKCLSLLIRDKLDNPVQSERIRKELAFCRKNKDKIEKQAQLTYERIINKVSEALAHNSCDFKLLEQAYIDYCIINNLECSQAAKQNIDEGDLKFVDETQNIKEWTESAKEKYNERMAGLDEQNQNNPEK